MQQLKRAGTAQNRKVYARHGVQEPTFGVSYANLDKLRKQIKVDHELASKLWASGNHDAKVLATMIADPYRLKSGELEAWSRQLGNYVITDAFVNVACRGRHVRAKVKKWTRARDEWKGQAGWNLVGYLAREDEGLPDSFFEEKLATIEAEIHSRKNRVRHAMNGALINIGVRNGRLRRKAEAAARRIGKVEVDHGQTSCKTPDAIPYIAKTLEHQKSKAEKAATRRKAAANKTRAKKAGAGGKRP